MTVLLVGFAMLALCVVVVEWRAQCRKWARNARRRAVAALRRTVWLKGQDRALLAFEAGWADAVIESRKYLRGQG